MTTTLTDLQYQMSNGNWTPCNDRSEAFVAECMVWRKLSRDEVIGALCAGKTLAYDSDWYSKIRSAPIARPMVHRPTHAPCPRCGASSPSRFTTIADGDICDDCV